MNTKEVLNRLNLSSRVTVTRSEREKIKMLELFICIV